MAWAVKQARQVDDFNWSSEDMAKEIVKRLAEPGVEGAADVVRELMRRHGIEEETAENSLQRLSAWRGLPPEPGEAPQEGAALRPADGWIAVKDRLPDRESEFLVWGVGPIRFATYHRDYGFRGEFSRMTPTHWRELPKGPRDEGGAPSLL